ncbi:MAG: type III pantothenate kinase [Flavobacterium sp.]|nr:type III pantothenate kinase [Flavobacterium sp.]
MILVIDVGNTLIKTAVFEDNRLLYKNKILYENWGNNIKILLIDYPAICTIVVASVGKLEKESFEKIGTNIKIYFISHLSKFPFQNLYATPETLGIDRMVLATGAVLTFPQKNRLVIDVGTCITYDYISEENQYLGGAISPGIRLRYESLHNFTSKLPLLTKSIPKKNIGNSTNESIHSGIINGICHEIDGFTNQFSLENENFIIILTGGDAEFLANRLKNPIFANSNFLLESLYQTYQFNQND